MNNTRVYNFGAGPAMLPESILLEAQAEFMNWQNTGMSILEINHRSDAIKALLTEAELDLRSLLCIPDNYHVLFLGSAARAQFSMIPMNLLFSGQQAGYIVSGFWSALAWTEAKKLASVYCIGNSKAQGYNRLPIVDEQKIKLDSSYIYYTPNETIQGVRFPYIPHFNDIPLIADMTSCLLSEPIHVKDYGLIFAGAQKNISIPGLTIVIIRDDLLNQSLRMNLPTMMDYQTHVTHHSMYATPPIFNCYLAGKMFKWIKTQGGIDALYQINCQKAAKLYQYIDDTSFYNCPVDKAARSLMNVCFSIEKKTLESEFVRGAERYGLYSLAGHRTQGGLRASIYNAMPMAGVDSLISFMQAFAKEHQS